MKRGWREMRGVGGWKAGREKRQVVGGHLSLSLCVGYEAASRGAQSPGFV